MKYYETNFEEYLSSYENYNMHPELIPFKKEFPKNISEFKNLIVYGPSGAGKYTQVLSILQAYSPSKLKYDKKISVTYEKQEKKKTSILSTINASSSLKISTNPLKSKETSTSNQRSDTNQRSDLPRESNQKSNPTQKIDLSKESKKKTMDTIPLKKIEKKQEYMYRISDIHYEIDMATLGCNSKLLWHDLFFQIVDIISVSFHSQEKTSDKIGIIVCKNFHAIHNELLDIFYSYMRHPLHPYHIQIKFILITEHMGFIPDNIINACKRISVKRPSKENYITMSNMQNKTFTGANGMEGNMNMMYDKVNRTVIFPKKRIADILEKIDLTSITNSKEIHSFGYLKSEQEIPVDVFNMINDLLLDQVLHPEQLKITDLRNNLYELLIYNVDIAECIWYIFTSLIQQGRFKKKEHITEVLNDIFVFFKYYNNNYRSIYHLESILLCMLNKIHYSSGHSLKT